MRTMIKDIDLEVYNEKEDCTVKVYNVKNAMQAFNEKGNNILLVNEIENGGVVGDREVSTLEELQNAILWQLVEIYGSDYLFNEYDLYNRDLAVIDSKEDNEIAKEFLASNQDFGIATDLYVHKITMDYIIKIIESEEL